MIFPNTFTSQIQGRLIPDFSLKNLNWFKVGGKAEYLFIPENVEDLIYFLKNKPEIDITILGAGSNILVSDNGIKGVVIKMSNLNNLMLIDESSIEVEAGVLDNTLANFALDNNIGGLEFLSGIPGSIGGAIAMNAGCFGREFKDICVYVKVATLSGEIKVLSATDMGFTYRKNSINDSLIFISTIVKGYKSNVQQITQELDRIKQSRKDNQPIKVLTGGSTFANPLGMKAWELIDRVGLRGYQIGGAKFSDKHCNFIINESNATSEDIDKLIEEAITRVKKEFDVTLECEIKRLL